MAASALVCLLLLAACAALAAADCPTDFKKITDKFDGSNCLAIVNAVLNGPPLSDNPYECPKEADATACFARHQSDWKSLTAECASEASKSVCMGRYATTSFYDWVDGECVNKLADTLDSVTDKECKSTLNTTLNTDDREYCPDSIDVKTCFGKDQDAWYTLIERCPKAMHNSVCVGHISGIASFSAFVEALPPSNAALGSANGAAAAALAAAIAMAALLA